MFRSNRRDETTVSRDPRVGDGVTTPCVLKHSSPTLRAFGYLAICFGFIGLVGQSVTLLRAQEELSLPAPTIAQADEAVTEPDGADESSRPVTLSEVLVGDVPGTFSQAAIDELLPESWSEWGYEVNDLFVRLYEDEPSAEDANKILNRLAVKRQTLTKAIGNPSYSMIHSRLLELRSQMDRNVKLVNAVKAAIRGGGMVDPNAARGEVLQRIGQCRCRGQE